MTQQIDLRGLACPEPVLKAKRLLDEVETIEALVDDDICVNNLQRLARSLKAVSHVVTNGKGFQVTISRAAEDIKGSVPEATPAAFPTSSKQRMLTVVFLSKDYLGQGDEDFSRSLLNMFLQTILEAGHEPRAILMANSGVKLMAENSQFKKVLDDFKARGCEVLVCGLCLEFYGIKDQVPKEQITNMFTIAEYLFAADKVLSP